MNILITGATGYVGSNLVASLMTIPEYKLYAITRGTADFPKGVIKINNGSNFENDIIIAKPDIVIHLASYLTSKSDTPDIKNLLDTNIIFGTKLLNALKKNPIKYFINVGSFSEYHFNDGVLNPTYLYAATKTAYRSILKYYSEIQKFKIIHVIPYSIYGGNDRQKKVIDILFDSLNAKTPINMSDGLQSLDFIHINDVVDFFLCLIKNLSNIGNEEVLYLGSGKSYTLKDIANNIQQITCKTVNVNWGATLPRERDTICACAPIGKLKEILQWQPKISIEQGLSLKYKNIR